MRTVPPDQFGRPRWLTMVRPIGLTMAATIAGSVWPPPARSANPPLDSLGFGRLLRRKSVIQDPDHSRYLHNIVRAGEHMLELVNDLLDLRRLEDSGSPKERVAVAVEPVLRRSAEMVRPLIQGGVISSAKAMCGAEPDGPDRVQALRRMKVLMALLRDRHPEVNLSPVVAKMEQALEKLVAPLAGCRTDDFDPSTFFRRMANSLRKLVAAAARLGDRSAARSSDVDLVVELLQPKVEFVRTLATANRDLDDKPSRLAAIRRLFGGRVVGPAQVMDALGIPRRTVMRDLNEIGEKEGRGRYRIPEGEKECAAGTSDPKGELANDDE